MTWTARSRTIGGELRRQRVAARLTLEDLGSHVGVGRTTIHRWETGERDIGRSHLVNVLEALGVTGTSRAELLDLHADLTQPAWWDADDVPSTLRPLAALEAQATQITDVAIVLVPGLLQTADFAAAAIRGSGVTAGSEIDRRVAARLARQKILPTITYRAVIDEAALVRPVGDWRVMAAQAEHLVELADEMPIHVVPLDRGAHAGLTGAFMLLEFSAGWPVVHIDGLRSSTLIDGRVQTREYARATEAITGLAMSRTASRNLIAEYVDRWRKRA
ncbi:helix-turn-helix domain-containing protein [Actinoalloteichus caeruleus]|uniref:helix-turn-helix domain-containing protein n=1 Tax=Actinoalloteichus cyanogriseus TaxID=2893586 RepID=UPI003AB064AD